MINTRRLAVWVSGVKTWKDDAVVVAVRCGPCGTPPTVGRLLRKLDYSLHVNAEKVEASSTHPDREQQFDYIAVQRITFTAAGLPIISTDTKKKLRHGVARSEWTRR